MSTLVPLGASQSGSEVFKLVFIETRADLIAEAPQAFIELSNVIGIHIGSFLCTSWLRLLVENPQRLAIIHLQMASHGSIRARVQTVA